MVSLTHLVFVVQLCENVDDTCTYSFSLHVSDNLCLFRACACLHAEGESGDFPGKYAGYPHTGSDSEGQ